MEHKLRTLILPLLFIILLSCFSGCQSPAPEPTKPTSDITEITNTPPPTVTAEITEAPTETTAPPASPTTTPEDTSDPRYDSENAMGPFTFGENTYKVYAGDTLVFFNTDKTVYLELTGIQFSDRELFALTMSFIDLNFDEIPDFSYFEPDGRRICYLANSDGSGYTYSDELSSLYKLSRCYETGELYATDKKDSEEYYAYKFEDGKLTRRDDPIDKFMWDIRGIADALAGSNALIVETEPSEIRGVLCNTYTVGGYITVATDTYGNYYIKDMPHKGFCRLSLNPNGRWSKSEKVTADML